MSFRFISFISKRLLVLIFCLGGLFVFTNTIQAADPGDVIINEIAWMGSSASSKDEWIELKNMTSQDIDISGWTVEGASPKGGALVIPKEDSEHIIPANNFYLISYYSIADRIIDPETTILDVIVGWRVKNMGNISLANTNNGNLVLKDREKDIIDIAKGDEWAAGAYKRSEGIYCSMERNAPPEDGSLIENWHTATDSQGFIAGAIEKGSPGKENSSYIPQDEEEQDEEDENGEEDEQDEQDEQTAGEAAQESSVSNLNIAPIAEAGDDIITNVGVLVHFDGSASSDPDSKDISYLWNLGDGGFKKSASFDYTYFYPGEYLVTLEIFDGQWRDNDNIIVTVYPGEVYISELLPNPEGKDEEGEWIELCNMSNEVVNISDWKIDDKEGGSPPFVFPEHSFMAPDSYLVFRRSITKIALNNNSDQARLFYPTGEIADEVSYEDAKSGYAAAKKGESFFWTELPTPGIQNLIFSEEIKKSLSQQNTEEIKEKLSESDYYLSSAKAEAVAPQKTISHSLLINSFSRNVKLPTLADLDESFRIKEVFAQNDYLAQFAVNDLNNYNKKISSDKNKLISTTGLNGIIGLNGIRRLKPKMILFSTTAISSILFGIWIVTLKSRFFS
jgi:hypothetical protein